MKTLYLLAPLMLIAGPAAAEELSIVITGRGLSDAPGDQAFDIVTIDRARIAQSASNRLEDLLREVPGFQQFRRSDARSANPTSQGATLRALGGNASSRALVLLDGVPQSDPFGGWISWPAYDPRRLEQIRVIRGGGSGVNGPGALAGTIELESRGAQAPSGGAADLAYGSRESIDLFGDLRTKLGSGHLSVSVAVMEGDGFIPIIGEQRGPADRASTYAQASVAVRAVLPVARSTELQANVSGFTDARERGTAFSDIKTTGADSSIRLIGRGRIPFSALVYLQTRDFSNQFASLNAGRSAVTPTLDQFSVPSTGLGGRGELRPTLGPLQLRLGADFRQTAGRTNELSTFVAGAPTRRRTAGGRTQSFGAFAEGTWESGPLTATAGGRIDRWVIADGHLREWLLIGGAPLTDLDFADRSGWETTGRGGLAWRAVETLTLRTAAYLGWRLPSLNELYRPFRLGPDATAANAQLSPERLAGVEVGAQWRPTAPIRIGFTLFDNRIEQAIANVSLGQGPSQFPGVGFVAGQFRQRQNLDAVTSRGVELDGEATFGPWRLAAGYSFAKARVEAEGLAFPLDGLAPAQSPRHSASASIGWQGPRGAMASIALRYVGAQYEDDLNAQRLPDAVTVDASATWPASKRLAIAVRGENLSDSRVVAGMSGAGIVERATPRTLWIGLRWQP